MRILTGVFLSVTIISPLLNISFNSLDAIISDINLNTQEIKASGDFEYSAAVQSIIKERLNAYIQDKADSLDLDISADIHLDDDFCPTSVVITGNASPYAKRILSDYIEDSIGIPKECQLWS